MSFLFMFALQCILPVFDSGAGEFVGLSVVNTENQVREYTVTGVSADGNNGPSVSFSLNPGTQRARLIGGIVGGVIAPAAEWLRIDSASGTCAGYLSSGNDETLTGLEPASVTGMSVYLPHVSVNTGFMELQHTDTLVAIINPGGAAAAVTAQLFGMDGVLRGSSGIAIPPRGSRSFRASEALGNFMRDNGAGGKAFDGYIRLLSNTPIAAWQRIDTPLSRSVMRGRTPGEIRPTTLAVIPHFVFGQTYGSFINLVNPADTPLGLELNAVDDRGNILGETIRLTLAPGEARRSSVGEFFRVAVIAIYPQPLISGSVRIREARGGTFQIAGNVEIFGVGLAARWSSMLYPITDTPGTNWTLPFSSSAADYFTGYAVANPNELLTVQTDIQVEVVDSSGAVVDRSIISLAPRNRRSALIPPGLASGYVRFSSPLPFFVLGSIGSRDGRLLDQVPALRQE